MRPETDAPKAAIDCKQSFGAMSDSGSLVEGDVYPLIPATEGEGRGKIQSTDWLEARDGLTKLQQRHQNLMWISAHWTFHLYQENLTIGAVNHKLCLLTQCRHSRQRWCHENRSKMFGLTAPDPRHVEANCNGDEEWIYVSTVEGWHTFERCKRWYTALVLSTWKMKIHRDGTYDWGHLDLGIKHLQ